MGVRVNLINGVFYDVGQAVTKIFWMRGVYLGIKKRPTWGRFFR